ncbi:MAG: DegV family protein [Ruminococcaceae bacterium]|nr:DegV family protein [Oscillospiraceae bacterium]
MKVRIIVDSTADLIPEVKEKIIVVPMTVRFGDEEFIDGVTINHKEFYEKLVETDIMPTTSQATPAMFDEHFKRIAEAGESAVVLTLASKLSGTYQSAMLAASQYENIYVVDSGSVAIGSGILAELALQLADSGMNAKEIAEKLEQEKKKVLIVAMVDTLEYLKRGGRVSKTVAFAGGLLNIKPVLSVSDGEILMLGKARGSKQGNNLLVTEIEKAGGVDFTKPLLLGYTGLSDVLLQKYIEDSKALWEQSKTELNTTVVGSVIGTHAGPGAVAVAFFKK